jgi:hypothetical protein
MTFIFMLPHIVFITKSLLNVSVSHPHYEQVKSPPLPTVIEHTRSPEQHHNTTIIKIDEISSNNNNISVDDRNTTR